jgi:hypothetical protein
MERTSYVRNGKKTRIHDPGLQWALQDLNL